MELVEIVGLICVAVTLFMFLTGIPPCVRMYRTGSVKHVPYILFLLSVVSCTGMVHYGLLINDNNLLFINAVGLVLNLIYMLVYISVVRQKSGALGGAAMGCVYLTSLYWYCFNVLVDPAVYAHTIAYCSSSITTLLILLGGVEVVLNFTSRTSDGMDVIMWIGSLACGVSWLTYGLMIDDVAIYGPNVPSILIASLKMFALANFPHSDDVKAKTN